MRLAFCYRNQRFAKCNLIAVCALILLAALHGIAQGAALELYETGAPDLGTASAGRAAMAADASTAATNPAGMTLLNGAQLMLSVGALLPMTNFDVGPKTTISGGGGGNAGVFFPLGSFFYVRQLLERLWLGVAVYSDFGLSANYGNSWAGRYYVNRESLITTKVNPSIAYALRPWLSIGVGGNFEVARLTFKSQINNVLPGAADGSVSFESWDEAFGGNVGILLIPIPGLRIGLTYQSPEFFKFGFRPFLTNLGPGLAAISRQIGGSKINVSLEQPQQAMASVVYEVLPGWSLMGNVGWQDWSAFGEFPVGIAAVNQRTLSANLNFSDTFQIAVGQQLRIGDKWLWSAGFAYDSSPVSAANRVATLPIDRQLRYGVGIQYNIRENLIAGAAWEFLDAGPAPFDVSRGPLAGTLQGHYSTDYLNFVAFNLNWKL